MIVYNGLQDFYPHTSTYKLNAYNRRYQYVLLGTIKTEKVLSSKKRRLLEKGNT